MWASLSSGNTSKTTSTATRKSSSFISDCRGVNAFAIIFIIIIIILLTVSNNCLAESKSAGDIGPATTANYCSEQISSNYSCFNQYLQNQFDYKGLPGSPDELHIFCDAFNKGMDCMDTYVGTCLGPADKSFYDCRMEPARHTMKQLCTKSELRDEYLRHANCYSMLSTDWDSCAIPIKELVEEEDRVSRLPAAADRDNTAKRRKICVAREQFLNCTISATEAKCTREAVNVLQRLAETLSGSHNDDEDCAQNGATDAETRNDSSKYDNECEQTAAVVRVDGSAPSRSQKTSAAHKPSDAPSRATNFRIVVAFASTTIIAMRAFTNYR